MRIAITDACIFIDLIECDIIQEFFNLKLELHTSREILEELYEHQQQILKAYESGNKLVVHTLTVKDYEQLEALNAPKALSDADKTVLYLAHSLDAMILSADKPVRNFSKKKEIEYHGMLWIFEKIIEDELITPRIVSEKLSVMVARNRIYYGNPELMNEVEKRIKKWSK